jgi:(p)ppGpp synthase/HD superfamily hydrolase
MSFLEQAVDKAGMPYAAHPEFVASQMDTDTERAVAWLHDVVEDTSVTLADLKQVFPREITDAVDAITKRADEAYDSYIARVKNNPVARKVKLADLRHNMDTSRLRKVSAGDSARLAKYRYAESCLLEQSPE